ncbi:MAG: hypothetical protein IBX53_11490 [Halomonas sp.]|uniref:hypothetical protein n=1 Tax=Halomonas sp. TaxID=1486246 RepID=UPI0019E6857E|nr:hypothetical protein [Halomonas sp.]MBE0489692.1 hypothetical protein [Halomonas sp.]
MKTLSTPRLSAALRAAVVAAPLLLAAGTALAHPGHGAPDVHAHTGHPLLLLAGAFAVLSVTGLALLLRRALRQRRLQRQR